MYTDRIKPYKAKVEELKKKITSIRLKGRKNPRLDSYYKLGSALYGVQVANTMMQMSRLSQAIQEFKNDSILNDARKEISSLLGEILKVVGDSLDGSLTENQDKLANLVQLDMAARLKLVAGIRDVMEEVQEALGTGSKWRWSFPDLHFNLSVAAKNLFDFKSFDRVRKRPNDPEYETYHEFLRFVVEAAQNTAQQYRSKYELSTREVSDLQVIQRIFEMLKRIYVFLGQQSEVQKITTSLDSINEKVESILADKEKKKK